MLLPRHVLCWLRRLRTGLCFSVLIPPLWSGVLFLVSSLVIVTAGCSCDRSVCPGLFPPCPRESSLSSSLAQSLTLCSSPVHSPSLWHALEPLPSEPGLGAEALQWVFVVVVLSLLSPWIADSAGHNLGNSLRPTQHSRLDTIVHLLLLPGPIPLSPLYLVYLTLV